MNLKKIKVCDPLYAYIYLDPWEKSLISHPIFQRLRSIRQLGFSDQAFPSGTHNRFSHSLGVCHLAGEAFDSIFNKNDSLPLSESKKQKFRKAVRMAALLHDIGHGPLSHSSESLMPPLEHLRLENILLMENSRSARHEDYGIKIIMEEEGLYRDIQQTGVEPEAIAQLLHPEFSENHNFFTEGGLNFLPLLRQIISSDFDVDKMDYLYRDSLYCGVKYGLIDFVWLISLFDCHIEGNDVFLAIEKEAIYTLESLIVGRQHMRLIVYFHHNSAIYNQMLKKYAESCQWNLPSEISDYILWTDNRLLEQLKSEDNVWARRITEHRVYLSLYEAIFFEFSFEKDKNIEFLKKKLREKGIDSFDINSEKHSINPQKIALKKYNVYLKNKALNQVQLLYDNSALLPIPSRRIQRIYVAPEYFSKAQSLLKQLKF